MLSKSAKVCVTSSHKMAILWCGCPHFPQISQLQCWHFPFSVLSFSRTMTWEHWGFGHHLQRGSEFTLKLLRNVWYFWYNNCSETNCFIIFSLRSWEQWGQTILATYTRSKEVKLTHYRDSYLIFFDLGYQVLHKAWAADVMRRIIKFNNIFAFNLLKTDSACDWI